ncbi:MAG: N-acetylneuraminate synthase family protein [Planctomycetota bacterium]
MLIGEREIGRGGEPYIIAEIGVNHDGDPDRALALTDAAARAGADAVKLQYFETDRLLSGASRLAAYQREAGETDPAEMLRRLELGFNQCARVIQRAHSNGLHALITLFSIETVDALLTLRWDALKVASPDLVNTPLLEALDAHGLPLIVSTGAAHPDEITHTRRHLDGAADRLAFLHCVSSYPTPPGDAQLGACAHLGRLVSPCQIGYSDHTDRTDTGVIAVECAGATILEKHLTDDRSRPGPDHAASLDEAGFTDYVRRVRERELPIDATLIRSMLGSGEKALAERERDVRSVSRQSVVATRDLPAGHVLKRDDVTVKRPGTGIPARELHCLIGSVLRAPAAGDHPLTPEHVGAAERGDAA